MDKNLIYIPLSTHIWENHEPFSAGQSFLYVCTYKNSLLTSFQLFSLSSLKWHLSMLRLKYQAVKV